LFNQESHQEQKSIFETQDRSRSGKIQTLHTSNLFMKLNSELTSAPNFRKNYDCESIPTPIKNAKLRVQDHNTRKHTMVGQKYFMGQYVWWDQKYTKYNKINTNRPAENFRV